MKYVEFEQLTTSHLRLRKLRRGDAADLFRFGSDEAVCRYMLWEPHGAVEESAASIEKSLRGYETGKYYRWGIALAESDTLIGIISLHNFDEERSACSFAYMLAREHWGKGYGTEALEAVIRFAFERMDMERIEADHFSENPASGAVMRKAGMRHVGTVSGKYEKDGRRYDAEAYILTRDQWCG